jgi:hypothetical protein
MEESNVVTATNTVSGKSVSLSQIRAELQLEQN